MPASKTIDIGAVLLGVNWFGSIGDLVSRAYRRRMFGDATLHALPDRPRFVINAPNVAFHEACPSFLSPVTFKLDPSEFTPTPAERAATQAPHVHHRGPHERRRIRQPGPPGIATTRSS